MLMYDKVIREVVHYSNGMPANCLYRKATYRKGNAQKNIFNGHKGAINTRKWVDDETNI